MPKKSQTSKTAEADEENTQPTSLSDLVQGELTKNKPEDAGESNEEDELEESTEEEDTEESSVEEGDDGDEGDQGEESESGEEEGSDDDDSDDSKDSEDEDDAESDVESKQSGPDLAQWIRDQFIAHGYDEDEVNAASADELQEELKAFLAKPAPAFQPELAGKLDTESADTGENSADDSSEATKRKRAQRKLKKLAYDRSLEQFVDFKDGTAVPKADLGPEAVEAAKAINAYANEYRKRQKDFFEDPLGTLSDDMEDIIQRRIDQALEKFQGEQASLSEKAQAEQAQVAEKTRLEQFREDNQDRLYVVRDGKIRKSLRDGTPVLTEFGERFEKVYLKMKARNPQALDSELLSDAMDVMNEMSPGSQATSKEGVKAAKREKQKKFLSKGRKNKVTRQVAESKPASVKEKMSLGANVTFLQAMLDDPANEDNPALAALR